MQQGSASVDPTQRFSRRNPCPICGGGENMPRGKGKRCAGYLSSDGAWAYCSREEFAAGLPLRDTDPPAYRHALELPCHCGVAHGFSGNGSREPEAIYEYNDEEGNLLFQVVRLPGKRFYQRQPDGSGGWINNLKGVRRVPYRLPQVIEAVAAGATIHIVDGEKDVEAIEWAGGVATCNSGGAGKWLEEYATYLRGAAEVEIVADKDAPGFGHAATISATLEGKVKSVRTVQAKTRKDAYDHLAAGHGLDEFEPLELAAQALPVEGDLGEPEPEREIVFVTLRHFLEFDFPPAESLVGHLRNGTNLLPRFGWVMPWGPAGSSKTSVLVDLCFHTATGRQWLHYPTQRAIRIVVIVNEGVPGGLQDKLEEKIELWDGDAPLDAIAVYASPWGEFTFRNERMFRHLQDYARDFEADYVAGDPLHTLGTIGSGTPQETEDFKHLLRRFGLWEWIGVITPHHTNKAGMVSGDWARHPDTVFRLEKEGKRPATKLTLEKARPADPLELGVPQLLEWVVETKSYRRVEIGQSQTVTDEEMLDRIRAELARTTDIAMSKLQEAVTGDSKRISALVKDEIAAGRILNTSPKKSAFCLRLPEHGPEPGAGDETENTEGLAWR